MTVRGLDEETKRKLRVRAAAHGHSMEEEVRNLIRVAVNTSDDQAFGLGTAIRRRFAAAGYGELEPLPRQEVREPPDFSDPDYDPT